MTGLLQIRGRLREQALALLGARVARLDLVPPPLWRSVRQGGEQRFALARREARGEVRRAAIDRQPHLPAAFVNLSPASQLDLVGGSCLPQDCVDLGLDAAQILLQSVDAATERAQLALQRDRFPLPRVRGARTRARRLHPRDQRLAAQVLASRDSGPAQRRACLRFPLRHASLGGLASAPRGGEVRRGGAGAVDLEQPVREQLRRELAGHTRGGLPLLPRGRSAPASRPPPPPAPPGEPAAHARRRAPARRDRRDEPSAAPSAPAPALGRPAPTADGRGSARRFLRTWHLRHVRLRRRLTGNALFGRAGSVWLANCRWASGPATLRSSRQKNEPEPGCLCRSHAAHQLRTGQPGITTAPGTS